MLTDSWDRDKAHHVSCFLRDLASRPFVWGHTDCALAIADWFRWQGINYDPAEAFRGTYRTEDECSDVLRANGGLLRLFVRIGRELELERIKEPPYPPGTIAVVRIERVNGRPEHMAAIATPSGRWAMKCTKGIVILTRVKVLAAWRI